MNTAGEAENMAGAIISTIEEDRMARGTASSQIDGAYS
jgi:hypothetical protein